jgi:hypothetical protein
MGLLDDVYAENKKRQAHQKKVEAFKKSGDVAAPKPSNPFHLMTNEKGEGLMVGTPRYRRGTHADVIPAQEKLMGLLPKNDPDKRRLDRAMGAYFAEVKRRSARIKATGK